MGDISVKFESLSSGADGIRANYAKLTGTLEQLESDLQPMISDLERRRAGVLPAVQEAVGRRRRRALQVLQNIGQAVSQAHQNYQTAENSAKQNWA